MFSLFKKKKETVSLKQFAQQVAAIATKYNKNHWTVKATMNAFGQTLFAGYVENYLTKDYSTTEQVIEDLINHCDPPKHSKIKEVEI